MVGVSQGGLQAIVAAGLDERVTFFTAGVPAGCDHAAGEQSDHANLIVSAVIFSGKLYIGCTRLNRTADDLLILAMLLAMDLWERWVVCFP